MDTMVLSALLDTRSPGRGDAFRRVRGDSSVIASFVSVAEILYGIEKAGWGQARRYAVERDLARFSIERPDDKAGRGLRGDPRRVRASRSPAWSEIHEADRWVATAALRLTLPLLSDDGVFVGVPGLLLVATGSARR